MKRSRSLRRSALVTLGFYYVGLLASMAALGLVDSPRAEARFNPLLIITRQIHKPNMLVVLDTSGSLTGVPGGAFDNTKEVGVDCDDGINCRGGDAIGSCLASGKSCVSDGQCQTTSCSIDRAACALDSDCVPEPGACTQSTCDSNNSNCVNASCFVNTDCPLSTTGTCAIGGASCNPKKPCTSTLKCTYGTSNCSSTSTPCAAYSVCQDNSGNLTTKQCSVNSDCPLKTTGTCLVGTASSCTSVNTCAKVCPDNVTVCSTDSACGVCSKGSTASGGYCTSSSDCTKKGAVCNITSGGCTTANNKCNFPPLTCTVKQASNPCIQTNPCVGPANTCTPGPKNSCLGGSASDTCHITAAAPGTSRMCHAGLTVCTKDSDCPAGDTCGPATSRIVIAKRVLANIVSNNSKLVNFGFMTFYQKKYYPYFSLGGAVTQTETVFISVSRLKAKKCFDPVAGPSGSCVISGVTYTLRPNPNSSYNVRGFGGNNADTNWCGSFCPIAGQGTGTYLGSYYTDVVKTGSSSSTPNVQATYLGKTTTIGGAAYRYYDSVPNYYNPYGSSTAPPIATADCSLNICNATCGARWDTQLAPFLDTTDNPTLADVMSSAINDQMQPASYGGLIAYNGTPTGCALENSGVPSSSSSAFDYMKAVQAVDTLPCRQNYVLLITDGEANGPGDNFCDSALCATADPKASGCPCKAVLAAEDLYKQGVKTFVVGFSGDVAIGAGKAANDNIAKAGGTDNGADGVAPFAFSATSESDLINAIQGAIYAAVQGSYSTSPPAVSAGTQAVNSVTTGNYALDSRVDFPSWKGHLLAYDATTPGTNLIWDAAVQLANMDWKTRRVYTSDTTGALVPIVIDSTGAITNKATLQGLGLGATPAEAELIARWALGDPAQGNPAVLGAIVNSTPIDVGQPGADPNPGGQAFATKYVNRPNITYVGSDDGMLHAFYTRDVTIAGVLHSGGSEAFAYLPPEMLPVVTNLYAQGGQLPDPTQHVFGLASSPKVKTLCTANCSDPTQAVWKTLLSMTDGFGGNEAFMLDVTDPTTATPFALVWHTANVNSKAIYNSALGQTISVPGFFFNYTPAYNDNRLIFTSGYPVTTGSTTQGRSIIAASAVTGEVITQNQITPLGNCNLTPEFTMLTDVAIARDNGNTAKKTILAAYAGDTWGSLWRFTPSGAPATSMALGCQQPLHYAPTVVQLDRDDFNAHPHEIYLVQATNSALDDVTKGFPASQIIFRREIVNAGAVVSDSTFGTSGALTLTAGVDKAMCAVTDATGANCLTSLPVTARPMGTPVAILKSDASGFDVLVMWYVPDAAGCSKGVTYMQILQLTAVTGGQSSVVLKQAMQIANEPVASPIVVGGKIVILSSSGPVTLNASLNQTFAIGQASPNTGGVAGDPFKILGWSETF